MMRFIAAGLLMGSALAMPGLEVRATSCAVDDCYRAVLGTRLSTRPAQATSDCMSFLLRTASPCVVTSTSTSTITTTVSTSTTTATVFTTTVVVNAKRDLPAAAVEKRNLAKRIISPECSAATTTNTAVPSYASACSGTARFSSVCSCAGFTPRTSTLSTLSSTVITTVTTSVTVTETKTISTAAVATAAACTPGPFVPSDSDTFLALCNNNFQGYNGALFGSQSGVADIKACAALCDAKANCNAVDFYRVEINGTPAGTCFFLNSATQGGAPNSDNRVDSAVKIVASTGCTPGPHTSTGGSVYSELCGIDIHGGNGNFLSKVQNIADLAACIDLCDGVSGCNAVDYYVADTGFGPAGTCNFLKSFNGDPETPSVDARVNSAFKNGLSGTGA